MKFDINNLIQVISKKYNLELPHGSYKDLNDLDINNVPKGFLEDIQNIVVPMVTEAADLEVSTKEDLYGIIPKEYLDEIYPIDVDGKKLMSLSQLQKSIKDFDPKYCSVNTNESANRAREILKASFVHDEYFVYSGLEHSWRMLESDYKVISREDHPAGDPLSSFAYYLELGFYPPPEIMVVIGKALENYFTSNGSMSLDDALFGEKHKKTNSLSYKKHKINKYLMFHFFIKKSENSKLSLEKILSNIIDEADPITMRILGFDSNIDMDTFMRGYRRWKKELREGKYE